MDAGPDASLDRAPRSPLRRARRRPRGALRARRVRDQAWDATVIHSGSLIKRSAFDDQYWPLRPVPALAALAAPRGAGLRADRPPGPQARSSCSSTATELLGEAGAARHPRVPRRLRRRDGRRSSPGEAPRGQRTRRVRRRGPRTRRRGASPPRAMSSALLAALDALRTTKTPYEVACLAEANRRARAGTRGAPRARSGRATRRSSACICSTCGATAQDDWRDARTRTSSPWATTPRRCTMLPTGLERVPARARRDRSCVDAGATCRGYCADITRTWVKGQRRDGERVRASRRGRRGDAAAPVRGDAGGAALRGAPRRVAPAGRRGPARRSGSCAARPTKRSRRGVTRAFYPHGLGHSLGLQTHDVGCALRQARPGNPFLRNTSDIAVGPGLHDRAGDLLHRRPARAAPRRARTGGPRRLERRRRAGPAGRRAHRGRHSRHRRRRAVVRNLTREHLPSGGGSV